MRDRNWLDNIGVPVDPMKLVSLWQPWASAMALGIKKIETRGWSTSYRGPLAIYATLTWNADCRAFSRSDACWNAFGLLSQFRAEALRSVLPFGAIIAVCDLVDCLPTEACICVPGVYDDYPDLDIPTERAFGNYDPGRFGFVTENMFRLPEPIPFKGRQGKLLDVPEEIEAEILRQRRAT